MKRSQESWNRLFAINSKSILTGGGGATGQPGCGGISKHSVGFSTEWEHKQTWLKTMLEKLCSCLSGCSCTTNSRQIQERMPNNVQLSFFWDTLFSRVSLTLLLSTYCQSFALSSHATQQGREDSCGRLRMSQKVRDTNSLGF